MSLVYQKSVHFLDQICNDDCSKARGQLVPLTCALFIQQFSLEIFASLNSPKVFSATTNGILKQIIHAQQVKHCCCDFLFLLLSHYTGFKTSGRHPIYDFCLANSAVNSSPTALCFSKRGENFLPSQMNIIVA